MLEKDRGYGVTAQKETSLPKDATGGCLLPLKKDFAQEDFA